MAIPLEAQYPLGFRQSDAQALGALLRQHGSATVIGAKRVGISNFLRFFLHHPLVPSTYIKNGPPCFVMVDLNSLVERTPLAFWQVTLKRVVDSLEELDLPPAHIQKAQYVFAESIQLHDLFFTLEALRKLLQDLAQAGYYTTIILLRFDRFAELLTPELYGNLQSLRSSLDNHLSFIFTSCRPLSDVAPQTFTKSNLAVFARDMYLQPATEADAQIMLETFLERYELKVSSELQSALVKLSGGHVQYLHLGVLKVRALEKLPTSFTELEEVLARDAEIGWLSEEILESLQPAEQEYLALSPGERQKKSPSPYLVAAGICDQKGRLFSPLFEQFVVGHQPSTEVTAPAIPDLTRKELELFQILESHLGQVVDRETIVEGVWPEQLETGVTDWAIDRLVARLRSKLKDQGGKYSIQTVVSRGYKLCLEVGAT